MNSSINIVCEINPYINLEKENVKDSGFIEHDPLEGLDVCNEEKFYKLDQIVFADPIEATADSSGTENVDNIEQQFTFFDKITVEKRVGRRNKYHIEMDDVLKPVCPKVNCNKSFSSLTLLKAHIRKVHCAEQSFTCELCGSSFTAKYLLGRHMAVHEKRKVECSICSKLLSKRTKLSEHMRFVHKQGLLKCDKCDQRFEKRNQYVRHKSSHKT